MSGLWGGIKDAAGRASAAASVTAQRTKLRTEMLLIDREIVNRRQSFGVELYDHVAPRLAASPEVLYASDDKLTDIMRPSLIAAQREIAALDIKETKLKESIDQAAVRRAGSITPAFTWQQKLANAGKSTALAGNEAKLATEIRLIRTQINHQKHEFGISLYATLEELEDKDQWLPTDRDIRGIYDSCRKDIERMRQRRKQKEKDLKLLSGGSTFDVNHDGPGGDVYAAASPRRQSSGIGTGASVAGGDGTIQIVHASSAAVLSDIPPPTPKNPQMLGLVPAEAASAASAPATTTGPPIVTTTTTTTTTTGSSYGIGVGGAPPQPHEQQQQMYRRSSSAPLEQRAPPHHVDPFAAKPPTSSALSQSVKDPFMSTPPVQQQLPDPFLSSNHNNNTNNASQAQQHLQQYPGFQQPMQQQHPHHADPFVGGGGGGGTDLLS